MINPHFNVRTQLLGFCTKHISDVRGAFFHRSLENVIYVLKTPGVIVRATYIMQILCITNYPSPPLNKPLYGNSTKAAMLFERAIFGRLSESAIIPRAAKPLSGCLYVGTDYGTKPTISVNTNRKQG